MRALKLFRRADDRPSLKDRAAALRARLAGLTRRPDGADPQRRIMVAGSFAAAFPMPALAAPAVLAGPHPDAELLGLHAALTRANAIEAAASDAYLTAYRATAVVLVQCPVELKPTRWEYDCVHPFPGRYSLGPVRFRWVPPREDYDSEHWENQAWTGKALRTVIDRAVPVLGRGGQTPFAIRRWKALLPVADAFDAQAEAIELRTDFRRLDAERDAARKACERLRGGIADKVATTPEGMAALVMVTREYRWKDTGGAWPNLLRSAANVSGVPLADLEHEYASTRHLRSATRG